MDLGVTVAVGEGGEGFGDGREGRERLFRSPCVCACVSTFEGNTEAEVEAETRDTINDGGSTREEEDPLWNTSDRRMGAA